MSVPIDERVVALKFNNQQFEEGTKTTMNTLSKLKEALNLTTAPKGFKELEQVANSTSFAGIEAGINKLQERFSTLGIVGMRVIENLTDTVMNTLGKAFSFVSDTIVSGGIRRAMNIENAHFQLQALLKDEERVQAVMDDAMKSVDGTAYAYDEAAKAASQFAASGLESGEMMLDALRGIVGVAAMTNSEYEGISRIFTTVAGQGRLMGDQLLQLSSRGLNAASTIANFMNDVNEGSVEVTDNVKAAVKEISRGAKVTEADIRDMVSHGEISFQIFSSAMTEAFADSAERANETFTGAFSNMKSALARIGAEFVSPLVEQNSEVIGLFNALRLKINDVKKALTWDEKGSAISGLAKESLMAKDDISLLFDAISKKGTVGRDELHYLQRSGVDAYETLLKYVNGVNDGSVRAKFAVKSTIQEITDGMEQTNDSILELVENGKIDLATFTSAMEWAYGDQRGLSKQFTDWFLDEVKGLSEAISKIDLSGPMEVFYYGVEIAKNGIKGIWSLVKPLGEAFRNVFLGFSTDTMVSFLDKVEQFTSKMRLSEESSENLRDAFTGLFSVIKLGIDIIFKLVGAFIPLSKPIAETGSGVLGLAGAIGRALTKFTEWVRSSERVKKAYNVISKSTQSLTEGVQKLISKMGDLLKQVYELPFVQDIVQKITTVFSNFGTYATEAFQNIVRWAERVKEKLIGMIPDEVYSYINTFVSKMKDTVSDLKNLKWQDVLDFFVELKEKLGDFVESVKEDNILKTFVANMKKFFDDISDAIHAKGISDKLTALKDALGGFLTWLGETFGPFFEGFNFDSVVGAVGVGGGIWGMIKMFESLEKVTGTLGGVNGVLSSVKSALTAYETDLHSKTLLKIAGSITLLAIAIALLSTIDGDKLIAASVALAIAGGVLLKGLTDLKKAINAGKAAPTALTTLAGGISKALSKFGKALEIHAIGSVAKNFGIGIIAIIGSIAAIWYLYQENKDALDQAIIVIGIIAAILAGLTVVITALGAISGGTGLKVAGLGIGVLALTASIVVAIYAMKKLFELEIPEDFKRRLKIFVVLFGLVAALGIAAGIGGRVAGENSMAVTPIIGMALMLYGMIDALNKLFGLQFPTDWEFKFGVLKELLLYCAGVALAVGFAGKTSQGESVSFSSVLALCAFLKVAVESIGELNKYPYKAMQRSVIAIGVVLLAVSVVLKQAAKVGNDKGAAKTVTGMAVLLLGVVGSLWLMTKMNTEELIKPLVILGVVCGMLAVVFSQIAKIGQNGTDALIPMVGVVSTLLIIVGGLNILAEQPWESILAAGVSISAVLGTLAIVFAVIAKLGSEIDITAVLSFDALVLAVIGIAYSLNVLAQNDWESILAAAGGVSLVLVALTGVFALITAMGAEEVLASTLALIAALIPLIGVGVVLGALAALKLEHLIETATALTILMVGLSVALGVVTLVGNFAAPAFMGIGLLLIFIVALGALLYEMGRIFSDPAALKILDDGGAALIKIGESLGAFVGAIIGGVGVGISAALVDIGENLALFSEKAQPFFDQMGTIKQSTLDGCSRLASMILVMCSADLLSSLTSFFNLFTGGNTGFKKFGQELAAYGPYVKQFAEDIKNVNAYKVSAVATMTEKMATAAKNLPKKSDSNKTLTEFGGELKIFGPAIVQFAEIVKDVKPEYVEGASAAASIMSELEANLPTAQDSLMGWLTGAKDLDNFGEELKSFGVAIVQFALVTAGITEESVTGAYNAGMLLTNLANAVPEEGGLKGWIFGDSDLEDFGTGLKTVGEALASFQLSTIQIDTEHLSNVIDQALRIADLAVYVQNNGIEGLTSFASAMRQAGDLGLTAFKVTLDESGTTIEGSVEGVFSTAKKTTESKSKTLIKAAGAAGMKTVTELGLGLIVPPALEGVVNSIGTLTGLVKSKTSEGLPDKTFNGIGSGLVKAMNVGQSLMFPKALETTNTLGNQTITSLQTKLASGVVVPIGENVTNYVAQGIKTNEDKPKTAAFDMASVVVNTASNGLPPTTFENLGSLTSEYVAKGIEKNKNLVAQAATQVASTITETFRSATNLQAVMDIGANVVEGLKKGMEGKTQAVLKTADTIATSVTNTVQKKFAVHSPSRVFEWIGEMLPEGLRSGILEKLGLATNAGIDLAEGTTNPVQEAVNKVLGILNGTSFNANPVITPELDLSNILSGTNEINDLFNQGFSANLNSALGVSSGFDSGLFSESSLFSGELSDLKSQIAELQAQPTQTFDNKFYIQGDDPEAIAEKVSQIISKQVGRSGSVWG